LLPAAPEPEHELAGETHKNQSPTVKGGKEGGREYTLLRSETECALPEVEKKRDKGRQREFERGKEKKHHPERKGGGKRGESEEGNPEEAGKEC